MINTIQNLRAIPAEYRKVFLSLSDYIGAAFIFLWGLWVLSWGPNAAISSNAFSELRLQAVVLGEPFRVVGLCGMVIGAIYATAVTINGRGMMWTPLIRSGSSLFAVIFCVNLSFAIAGGQPSSTGVFTYLFLAGIYSALFCANLNRLAASIELIWEARPWRRKV